MSRILLADDSPHAQRMGERILREEGFEVVTVTDGNTALMRLSDVDPDVVFADVSLPSRSGYEICQEVKKHLRHQHVRVILTAGLLEPFDEAQAAAVKCDGVLKKPFEASAVVETIRPLIRESQLARGLFAEAMAAAQAKPIPASDAVHPPPEPIDPVKIEAAITLALEAALPALIREITEKVLVALGH